MRCDPDQLRAFADDALTGAERTAVAEHLAECAPCRAELTALQRRAAMVAALLAAQEPRVTPDPARALARFRASTLAARVPPWEFIRRRYEMTRQSVRQGTWRPLAIGAAAMVCLAILFSFAPAREAAADFLGLFRVRKFAVIPVDPASAQQLEALVQMADAGAFGQPTFVRETGAPQAASNAVEAGTMAGFSVRVPAVLPDGAGQPKFHVTAGPAVHYELDRPALQAILEATQIPGVRLPETDRIVIDVDIANIVSLHYWLPGRGDLGIVQVPGPQVTIPDGIDLAAFGELALRFLGLPEADARRLAQSIDWTSTVVIPLPTDVGTAREVTVDGVTGLLLEDIDNAQRNALLLWQRDNIVYALNAEGINSKLLLQVADSLH